ncbi:MAG: hypothetical protein HRT72_12405 [Flavobacteriales bacterium]|nr:hypothetical protein [Flavobacteriales bacterium]
MAVAVVIGMTLGIVVDDTIHILDRANGTLRYFAKGNRRIGSTWKATIEVSGFGYVVDSELFISQVQQDGYGQFSLSKFF